MESGERPGLDVDRACDMSGGSRGGLLGALGVVVVVAAAIIVGGVGGDGWTPKFRGRRNCAIDGHDGKIAQ